MVWCYVDPGARSDSVLCCLPEPARLDASYDSVIAVTRIGSKCQRNRQPEFEGGSSSGFRYNFRGDDGVLDAVDVVLDERLSYPTVFPFPRVKVL